MAEIFPSRLNYVGPLSSAAAFFTQLLSPRMFQHSCHIDDMTIIGQRPNPLDDSWNAWTLVVCKKCKKLYEWQHHSDEQMHGGDLEITALPTPDYLRHKYQMAEADVEAILRGERKVRRYDRYKKVFVEELA